MSCFVGPNIASNSSIVFSYDMNNTQKSWIGAPTTNLISDPFALSGNPSPLTLTGYETTNTRTSTLPITDMANISNTWFVSTKTTSTNGRVFFLAVSSLSTMTDYCFSMYAYTNDANITQILCGTDNSASSPVKSSTSYNVNNRGTIQRINCVFTSTSGGQVIGVRVGSTDPVGATFYFTGIQVEAQSFPTPVVNGTRANTQAIIDLSNNNIITATSLTYLSSGTFSFNGTSNQLNTGVLPYQFLTTGVTISLAFRYTQTTTNDNVISWGNGAFNAGLSYSWELRIRGGGAVEFSPGVYTIGSSPARLNYNQNPLLNGRDVLFDVVYNANGMAYMYENGTQVASYDYTGVGTYTNTQALRIGRGTDTNFPGNIYFVKIYNRPLSAAEIAQNFNATRSRFGL